MAGLLVHTTERWISEHPREDNQHTLIDYYTKADYRYGDEPVLPMVPFVYQEISSVVSAFAI